MRAADIVRFTARVLGRDRFRAAMLLLAMGVGVSAVITLTALGEGARGYVLEQFAFLGRDTLVVLPGRNETTGGVPPLTGTAVRDITLDDAQAIRRFVPGVTDVAPLIVGAAQARFAAREREILVLGTTARFFAIRGLGLRAGTNLPDIAMDRAQPVVLIGEKVQAELLRGARAVGQWLRIGDRRFRVVGVLRGRGDSFGMDLSDAVLIPVASAQALFNRAALFRVLAKVGPAQDTQEIAEAIRLLMKERHQGEEDVTIISPDALLAGFNRIMLSLTAAVASIAAISLLVAGIMTMNIMLISVRARTGEIGLLMALGASPGQVRMLFLVEAGCMALLGALLGVLAGYLLITFGRGLYPDVPFAAPPWVVGASVLLALSTALLFAWFPARRAAALPPVTALLQNR